LIAASFIDKVMVIAKMETKRPVVKGAITVTFLVFASVTLILVLIPDALNCNTSTLGRDWVLFLILGIA